MNFLSSMRFWHRRASVQVGTTWFASSAVAVWAIREMPDEMSANQAFAILTGIVVCFTAAATAAIIKWLRGAGQNVTRRVDALPVLNRIETRMGAIETRISGVIHRQDEIRDHVSNVRERLARMEGTFDGLQRNRNVVPFPIVPSLDNHEQR